MHRRCGPATSCLSAAETRLVPRSEAGRPLPTGRSRSLLLRPCRSPSPPEPCAFASRLPHDCHANFSACKIACNKKAEPASPAFSESCFPKTHPCRTRPGTSRPTRAARSLSKTPDAFRRAPVFRISPPGEPRPLSPRAPAAFHKLSSRPRQLQRRESRAAQAKTPQSSALCPRAQRSRIAGETGPLCRLPTGAARPFPEQGPLPAAAVARL